MQNIRLGIYWESPGIKLLRIRESVAGNGSAKPWYLPGGAWDWHERPTNFLTHRTFATSAGPARHGTTEPLR